MMSYYHAKFKENPYVDTDESTPFRFLRNRGTSQFISGNKGTGTPWEGLSNGKQPV